MKCFLLGVASFLGLFLVTILVYILFKNIINNESDSLNEIYSILLILCGFTFSSLFTFIMFQKKKIDELQNHIKDIKSEIYILEKNEKKIIQKII